MPRMFDDEPSLPWCGQYILGGEDGHTPIPCYSLLGWGRWLELAGQDRVVAWTGNGDKCVSTVFLGLDHRHGGKGPPIVFESMLFVNGHSEEMERYSSWDDAEIGHKAFVRRHLINVKTRVRAEINVEAIDALVETLAKRGKPGTETKDA